MQSQESIHIDAPPERLWRMVSDVTRMGEWSPITYRCEWLAGASGPQESARFKGYNKLSPAKWWTICEVTESVKGKVFEFRTVDVSFPFSLGVRGREMTRWRYDFEPDGIGTKVTESYSVAFTPAVLRFPEQIARRIPGASTLMDRRRAQTELGIKQTLERLKVVAEEGVEGA